MFVYTMYIVYIIFTLKHRDRRGQRDAAARGRPAVNNCREKTGHAPLSADANNYNVYMRVIHIRIRKKARVAGPSACVRVRDDKQKYQSRRTHTRVISAYYYYKSHIIHNVYIYTRVRCESKRGAYTS
jgi:hypothetical protein